MDIKQYLEDLELLVNIDSGTAYASGVDKVGDFFTEKFSQLGYTVTKHNVNDALGKCISITNTNDDEYDVLILGHIDTVFPVGTVSTRPFTIKEDRAYGPGVVDMKAGALSTYYVLKDLEDKKMLSSLRICVALNSQEETGSRFARPWIEDLAKKSKCALILEPARANGALVNERKGLGRFTIEFEGIPAHAGVDPQNGRSAIAEMAHWILGLHSITDLAKGLTVNAGIVSGGTGANVVAKNAKMEVDFRVVEAAQVKTIEEKIAELKLHADKAEVKVNVLGGVTRPPMVPTTKTHELCELIGKVGKDIGIDVKWEKTGGGSDGNFTGALNVPTIDGLGPIGGGTHSDNEYLVVSSIEPRCKLVEQILLNIK